MFHIYVETILTPVTTLHPVSFPSFRFFSKFCYLTVLNVQTCAISGCSPNTLCFLEVEGKKKGGSIFMGCVFMNISIPPHPTCCTWTVNENLTFQLQRPFSQQQGCFCNVSHPLPQICGVPLQQRNLGLPQQCISAGLGEAQAPETAREITHHKGFVECSGRTKRGLENRD